MLMLILTWTGAALGLSLLLIMALGPAIVEMDARWAERKHEQRGLTEAAAGSAAEPSRGYRIGSSSTTAGSRPANGPRIAVRSPRTRIS